MLMIRMKTPKHLVAQKLYPDSISLDSAMQRLRREISDTSGLKDKLAMCGCLYAHSFNKKQMEVLLETLGLTHEEFDQLPR